MRELKFRAWTDTENMIYDIMPCSDRVCIDLKSDSFEQIWQEFDYMQYTGLKDETGKEIYEGDIVAYIYDYVDSRDIFNIEENDEDAKIPISVLLKGGINIDEILSQKGKTEIQVTQISFRDGQFITEDVEPLYTINESCMVIGNIYENNNLIK